MREQQLAADPVIQMTGITKVYPPAIEALRGVDFSIKPGEIRGLVGMNGAGKSTMIKILSGVEQPTSGTVTINGLGEVVLGGPGDADRAGIGVVHQELPLLANLTAADNVALGMGEGGMVSRARRREHERHYAKVAQRLSGAPAGSTLLADLDIDGWQMVALVRALSSGAKVLVLDEPTSSLNSAERESLHRSLRDLAEQHVAIIYVSHFLDDVLDMCGTVTVMRDGEVVADRPVTGLDTDSLLTLMTGQVMSEQALSVAFGVGADARVRLELKEFTCADAGPLEFQLREGETVGLYGLRGCGATEVVEGLFGLRPATGSVLYDGQQLSGPPRRRMERGLSFISGNRSKTLLQDWTVARNHALPGLRSAGMFKRLRRTDGETAARASVDQFGVVGGVTRPIGTLSGGNQQKVSVGRALAADLIIADEPTRGVDAKARLVIHQALRATVTSGASLLIHSTEAEELVALCDRVLLMEHGRVTGQHSGASLTVDALEAATMTSASLSTSATNEHQGALR